MKNKILNLLTPKKWRDKDVEIEYWKRKYEEATAQIRILTYDLNRLTLENQCLKYPSQIPRTSNICNPSFYNK